MSERGSGQCVPERVSPAIRNGFLAAPDVGPLVPSRPAPGPGRHAVLSRMVSRGCAATGADTSQ
jgi:hypothetical protein